MCTCTSKLFLGILSLIFLAAAVFLFFVGGSVYAGYHSIDKIGEATYTLLPATILLAIGGFFVILAVIGCVGAYKEQKCLLGMFFVVLLVIVLAMVAALVVGLVYRKKVSKAIEKTIEDGFWNRYGSKNESTWTKQINYIQKTVKCCGVHNYTDWVTNSSWYRNMNHTMQKKHPYPDSCCKGDLCEQTKLTTTTHKPTTTTHKPTKEVEKAGKKTTHAPVTTVPTSHAPTEPPKPEPYQDGCFDKVSGLFEHWLAVIAGTGAGFALVTLLGMISACVLICKKRDEVPYLGLGGDGMRV